MTNDIFYSIVLPWIYFPSVITFILFAYDKHCAVYGKWRIPEIILLVGSLCMGAFGAMCGMIFFNHKTSKKLFTISIPVLLLLQTLISVYFLTR